KSRNAAWMRIVDDSREMPMGDWDDITATLPHGYDRLIEMMEENDVNPGYWLSPFTVSDKSRVYKEHPDWFARNATGEIFHQGFYGNNCAFLDSSKPEVQEHLRDLASRIRKKGFRFVHTDFLLRQFRAPGFADPTLTKVEVHRKGLEALREGFGDDVYWLGCTALPGPCMGLVDGFRVSGDSFGGFGRPAYAYAQTGMRWFYHRNVWFNDPDSIITRGHWDFETKEYRFEDKGVEFNRGWMSWIALAGTPMTYGDFFDDLPEHSIDLYRKIFPPVNAAGRPLDLWENNPHHLWGISIPSDNEPTKLFGAFNYFKEKPVNLSLNLDEISSRINGYEDPSLAPSEYIVWDFWNERIVPTVEERMNLSLAPKEGSLFCLREMETRPQLLSTTGHFSQGAREISEIEWREMENGVGELVGKVKGNGGDPTTLYFHVPDSFRLKDARLMGTIVSTEMPEASVLKLEIPALEQPEPFQLRFSGVAEKVSQRQFVDGFPLTSGE
ncbi:MAG: alpha-galactosidase, partial [Candidatus Omnitrophica bacterium]|nr:alpha-galactosidase [Candidatus Omnitrophota bacterium]